MLHEIAAHPSAQLSKARRRHTAPVPYTAQRAVPGVLTDLADIREYMLQARSRFEQNADDAIWDRWCLNSDPYEEGTIDEHVAVLRGIASELAGQLRCLAIIDGELNEHNPDLEPPYQPLKTSSALREMLSRRMTELYGRMEQTTHCRGAAFIDRQPGEPYLNGNWPLVRLSRVSTSYGSVNSGAEVASVRELSAAALQEVLIARRWPGVPVITKAMLARIVGRNQEPAVPLSALVAEISQYVADGAWRGSISDLHRELERTCSLMSTTRAFDQARPALVALGFLVAKTGRRIGESRRVEWLIQAPASLHASGVPSELEK